MLPSQFFNTFSPAIRALSASELADDAFLKSKFRVTEAGHFNIVYTPFEYVNPQAKLIVCGITPGATQLKNALTALSQQLRTPNISAEEALRQTKLAGAFSGKLQLNLKKMLHSAGVTNWLGAQSGDDLFGQGRLAHRLQTTSLLKNAVFYKGKDYNGRGTRILKQDLLIRQMEEHLLPELAALPDVPILPLGEIVDETLQHWVQRQRLDGSRILPWIPHPSGANNGPITAFMKRDRLEKYGLQHHLLQERVAGL